MQGKSYLPFPQKGFWGPSIPRDAAAISKPASRISHDHYNYDYPEAVVKAFARSLEVYEPKGADTDETTDMPEDRPYFTLCEFGRCAGGDFACEPGYEGVLCSLCGTGRFPFINSCYT